MNIDIKCQYFKESSIFSDRQHLIRQESWETKFSPQKRHKIRWWKR